MAEQIITLLNNPIVLVLLMLIIMSLLSIIRKGNIKSIGKDGITFNERDNSKIDKLIASNEALMKDITAYREKHDNDIKELKKALLRLQIISDATDLKTKLTLFDEYKSLGGNSYIDLYIEQQKQKEVNNG